MTGKKRGPVVIPHTLIDAVKAFAKIESDRDLAKLLEIQPSGISKIRKKVRVSPEIQIKIHKFTQWPFDRIEALMP